MKMQLKLIVKVPNNKLGDQSFTVDASWTVQQLKTFLSNEYPSKPATIDQKLIYSGHLLKDDQQLQQVFQPVFNHDSVVTIHMVCPSKTSEEQSSRGETMKNPFEHFESVDPNSNHVPSNLANDSGISNDHDNSVNPSQNQSATMTSSTQSTPSSPFQTNTESARNLIGGGVNLPNQPALANAYLPYAASLVTGPVLPGQPLSPEEANTLNQLYSRLLSSQLGHHAQPVAGFASPFFMNPLLMNGQLAQMMTQQQQLLLQQQPLAQAAQQQQQPLAQPAANFNDGENNGDWLEWLHWLSRFAVLISIVYYYSSLTRFILVISFPIFLFLYQNGIIFSRNNNQQMPAQAAARDRPVRQELHDQGDQGDQDDPLDPRQEDAHGIGRVGARPEVESHLPTPNASTDNANNSEERTSSVRIIRTVLSSFLTSLIPEQPQFNFN